MSPSSDRLAVRSLRILLVEDHPYIPALKRLLARLGHDVTPAASVAEALEIVCATFDLLLSDIGLVDGSGLGADGGTIRAMPRRPSPDDQNPGAVATATEPIVVVRHAIAISGDGASEDVHARAMRALTGRT